MVTAAPKESTVYQVASAVRSRDTSPIPHLRLNQIITVFLEARLALASVVYLA
jgi:hypothetical protein